MTFLLLRIRLMCDSGDWGFFEARALGLFLEVLLRRQSSLGKRITKVLQQQNVSGTL